HPCQCDADSIERWLAINWQRIYLMDRGESEVRHQIIDPVNHQQYSRLEVMHDIGILTAGLQAVRAGKPCTPHCTDGMVGLSGADDGCHHGSFECAVRALHPTFDPENDPRVLHDMLERIRDLRRLARPRAALAQ